MDPLDPLSTSDPTAPHTSSISSNRFLLKKAEDKPIVGNIVKVITADDLEADFPGVWEATAIPESAVEGKRTALVHMRGLKLVWKSGKAALAAEAEGMVMVRLVAGEAKGTEVGELKGVKIWAELETEAGEEKADVDLLLQALCAVFPYDERILAFYLYTHFKLFPTLSSSRSEVTHPSDLVESISQLNLAKFRTGVPFHEAQIPTSSTETPVDLPAKSETTEIPQPSAAVPSVVSDIPLPEVLAVPDIPQSEALADDPQPVVLEPPATDSSLETSTQPS